MISNFVASIDAWKILLTLKLLFISSKDTGKKRDMNSKSEKFVVVTESNINYLDENIFNFLI